MSGQRFLREGVRKAWSDNAVRKSCPFCVYANRDTARTLLYRDHKVVAFASENPRAIKHLLVVPKLHYNTVADLSPAELPLLSHMLRVGKNLLDPSGAVFSKTMMRVEDKLEARYPSSSDHTDFEAEDEETLGMRFGFHLPPFHSVDHLHMHCLLLPFSASLASLRYMPSSPWFVSTRKLMQDLKHAKEVQAPGASAIQHPR